jgi:hypothetical protein
VVGAWGDGIGKLGEQARAATSAPAPYVAASPEYGANIFIWQQSEATVTLQRVRDLDFTWQKSLIRWRDVEGVAKGQLDWSAADALLAASRAAGLRVLARVDFPPAWARADGADDGPPDHPQDYADFVGALAARYHQGSPYGHLDAIEIWNEPNLSKGWGDARIDRQAAAEYVHLLALAHAAVKSADPSIVVLSAALAATATADGSAQPDDVYLQWLYDAGLRGSYDALGAHAHGYKAPPEVSPDEAAASATWGGQRAFSFRRVEDLRAVMERNGDGDRQVWVTEFGWTTDPIHKDYSWYRVTEQQQAIYLVRAYDWARRYWAPWIGPMLVWNLPDPRWGPDDEKYWWGILAPDGTPRQAYRALQHAHLGTAALQPLP